MDITKDTTSGVFIIESLDFEDELYPLEGEVLSSILSMSDIDNQYFYIRTKSELSQVLDKFIESGLRFLHLSFHGTNEAVSTTLDSIPHKELGEILRGKLKFRRLFMSTCSGVNESLADNLFVASQCNSIIGPNEDVDMHEIAVFWASFYHLMFKSNDKGMNKKDIVPTLFNLVKLYNVPFKYYRKSKIKPYYKEENFLITGRKPRFKDINES